MKNLIDCFKVLRYTFKFKLTMVAMVLFMLFGWGTLVINGLEKNNSYVGYFWGPFASIFLLQCLFNVLYAKIVVSSPKFKKMIIEGTSQIYLVLAIIMYFLYIVLAYFITNKMDIYFDLNVATFEYVITAISMAIYIQVYYRNMFLGILSMAPVIYFAGISSVSSKFIEKISALDVKSWTVMICGFAGMVVGYLIVYGIGRLIYRFSFSDKVMKMQLSRIK